MQLDLTTDVVTLTERLVDIESVSREEQAIADARDSLALNPRARRARADVDALAHDVARLFAISTQVAGMTRAFVDDYEPGIASDAEVAAIADHLHRAAHDLRRDERSSIGEPAALTRPLEVLSAPEHWVLIGSLMVDLRRIHDALAPQDG